MGAGVASFDGRSGGVAGATEIHETDAAIGRALKTRYQVNLQVYQCIVFRGGVLVVCLRVCLYFQAHCPFSFFEFSFFVFVFRLVFRLVFHFCFRCLLSFSFSASAFAPIELETLLYVDFSSGNGL